jgi:hypothetical protein
MSSNEEDDCCVLSVPPPARWIMILLPCARIQQVNRIGYECAPLQGLFGCGAGRLSSVWWNLPKGPKQGAHGSESGASGDRDRPQPPQTVNDDKGDGHSTTLWTMSQYIDPRGLLNDHGKNVPYSSSRRRKCHGETCVKGT